MSKLGFLEAIRNAIRIRHYSYQTEKSYLSWNRCIIRFHQINNARELIVKHIEDFLTYIAVHRKVSSSTQQQALCAIVFAYKHVLNIDTQALNYAYAKQPVRLPQVLNEDEAMTIIGALPAKYSLIASILFGGGLRLNEALKLRVKDVDFTDNSLFIFRGKGRKDRKTILPKGLNERLKTHLELVKLIHERDLSDGHGIASLPSALLRKYQHNAKQWYWQYIFPASHRCLHPTDGYVCRHHIHPTAFTRALRSAVKDVGIEKRVTAHTFRHSIATSILKSGADIRTLQELLGHKDIKTTQIYTHVAGLHQSGIVSPFDK
ncbi:integron integrase [Shewanella waksmanii]|uniref:integron integrase n=1 Tax=Shewanella waksmanii TaxID=213783 RepID=UPI0037369BA8